MIFICLTPNPKGEHLKIIEFGSPPLGVRGSKDFSECTQFDISNLLTNRLLLKLTAQLQQVFILLLNNDFPGYQNERISN